MIHMEERLNYLDSTLAELAHAQMRTEIALKRYFDRLDRDSAETQEHRRRLGETLNSSNLRQEENTGRLQESWERDTAEMKRSMDFETRKMQKIWRDLVNKMGTIAEDVVAPNIPRLAVEEFGLTEVLDMMPRARRTSRRGERRSREYDIVCAGPGKVIVVEVKDTPTLEKIREVPARLEEFFDFFPEYEGRELIGIFASWSIDESLLPAISAAGLYGIAMGEDTMDVVARPCVH